MKKIINKLDKYIYYLTNYSKCFKFQYLSTTEIDRIKTQKLKHILEYAVKNISYYRHLEKEINFDNFSQKELLKFPIINKKILQNNFDLFLPDNIKNTGAILLHTSGSTGEPFGIYNNKYIHQNEDLTYRRFWGMGKDYHYGLFDPIVFLRGYSPSENEPIYKRGNNIRFLSPFHINEENLSIYVNFIKKSKVKIIHGYPSSIYILTILLKENGIKLNQIKTLTTSSEMVLPKYRELIEDYWGIKLLDSYGQGEATVLIQQCHCGNYHNNDDYGLVEIGQNNEIIGTSLYNDVMPFIRYDTGDIAIPLDKPVEKCPCGRNLSIPFKSIQGRSDDILVKGDGTKISTTNMYVAMEYFDNIAQFKITQYENKSVKVLIVPKNNFSTQDLEKVESEMRQRLGNVKLEIILTTQIERNTKSGKIKAIESFAQ